MARWLCPWALKMAINLSFFLLFFRENASMRILVEQVCRNSGLGLGTEFRQQEREECHGNTLWGSGLIVMWKKMLYAASHPVY